ncbi:hypothetical protein R1flu_010228 [Riccia fluitans]|uniref:F-box domain-containing protein n=1 Tax=Riccia fluitans TaxID=41844 RepID=A0ABD1Z4D2_9MARC
MEARKVSYPAAGHWSTFAARRRARPMVKRSEPTGSSSGDHDIVDTGVGEPETIFERHDHSKRGSALETCSSSSAPQLPEELLALVFSKLPFPKIFTVKLLSKLWYHKLPSLNTVKFLTNPPAAQVDEGNFIVALTGAADTGRNNWCSLCPIFLSGNFKEIVGYDGEACRWRKLPIHHKVREFLQDQFLGLIGRIGWIKFDGPLLFVYEVGTGANAKAMVANSLVGTWEIIAGCSASYHTPPIECRLDPKDYKVVIHHLSQLLNPMPSGNIEMMTNVFDSRTRSWRRGETILMSKVYSSRLTDYDKKGMFTAFLDGHIYCMLGSAWSEKLDLWRYDLETEVWAEVPVDLTFGWIDHTICGIFSVASQIIVALMVENRDEVMSLQFLESALVFVLDLETLQLSQPLRSPQMLIGRPAILHGTKVVTDSECLYFVRSIRFPGQASYPSDIWSFHVRSRTWTAVTPPPDDYMMNSGFSCLAHGAFAPGLNPLPAP